MTPEYISFLKQLRDNNNREWFRQHKSQYDALRQEWIADVNRLIAACAEWESAYRWKDGKDCVFRIYRDTRFSKDKTPYKTHFSAGFTARTKNAPMAGFYISAGFEKDFTGIYGGIWNPEPADLKKIRKAIDDNAEEFEEIISEPEMLKYFPTWCGRALKTIPKGYPKDHPMAASLRQIDIGREYQVEPEFFTRADWPLKAAAIMRTLKPLNDFINYSLEEEV